MSASSRYAFRTRSTRTRHERNARPHLARDYARLTITPTSAEHRSDDGSAVLGNRANSVSDQLHSDAAIQKFVLSASRVVYRLLIDVIARPSLSRILLNVSQSHRPRNLPLRKTISSTLLLPSRNPSMSANSKTKSKRGSHCRVAQWHAWNYNCINQNCAFTHASRPS